MMEFKQVVDNFKVNCMKAGNNLSLLPLLMKDLIDAGLDASKTNGEFYKDLSSYLFSERSKEFQVDMMDALMLLGKIIPLPKVEVKKEKPVVKKNSYDAIVDENGLIKTDHLIGNIPHEDDEGDPLYTPPEERINLKPEDFASKEYDEEFCALIGFTKDRR